MDSLQAMKFSIALEESILAEFPAYIRTGDFDSNLNWRRFISRVAEKVGYSVEIIRDRESLNHFTQLVICTIDELAGSGALMF
jgi:hypothetical protein